MQRARDIISLGLSNRAALAVKVRQPLLSISYGGKKLSKELEAIIMEEVNVKEMINTRSVKEVEFEGGRKISAVELNAHLTPELQKEGLARELVRQIQSMRKKADFNVEDRIKVYFITESKILKNSIKEFSLGD